MFPVDKVVTNILVNPAKPSLATVDKNKKKENNLKKIKQKRKRSAREKIYLGQFQEDLNFLEDFVEFQKVCQQQIKTQYTVRKYLIRKYFLVFLSRFQWRIWRWAPSTIWWPSQVFIRWQLISSAWPLAGWWWWYGGHILKEPMTRKYKLSSGVPTWLWSPGREETLLAAVHHLEINISSALSTLLKTVLTTQYSLLTIKERSLLYETVQSGENKIFIAVLGSLLPWNTAQLNCVERWCNNVFFLRNKWLKYYPRKIAFENSL